MSKLFSILLLLLLAGAAVAQTPATELHAALLDLEKLPPQDQLRSRYLSIYNVPFNRRGDAAKVVDFALNGLSRSRTIARVRPVSPTLLRLDTRAYTNADTQDAWELSWGAVAAVDPFLHIRTEIIYAGKRQIVTVDGGWLDQKDARAVAAYSGSMGAVLRADYFVAAATNTPTYYAFTGIPPKESDFLKSIGVDSATIDRLRANAGANLLISGITNKPRRLFWQQSPLGGVYATLDVTAVDAEHDPIRRAASSGPLQFKTEAGEWYAMSANGFWRTALYSATGERQDAVPAAIATDAIATEQGAPDTQVRAMVSCIRCHTEGGLRPFRDDQTALFKSGHVDLRSYDHEIIQRIREFYDEPRLQRQMQFDRETYAAAVKEATGWTPEEAAKQYADFINGYSYQPVTYNDARRELGIPPTVSLGVIGNAHDPNILQLIDGRSIPRGLWEGAFAEAATLTENWRRNTP